MKTDSLPNPKAALWLAVAAGAVIEGTLCVLYALFGRVGPCGPANDITGVLLLLHLPGLAIAQGLPPIEWIQLPVMVGVSAALWGLAALVVIHVVRSLAARGKRPGC